MKTSRTDLVLQALRRAQEQGDGWLCGRRLAHNKVGGWRYSARVHELRQRGHLIDKRVCRCDQCRYAHENTPAGTKPARIYSYRLEG